MYQIGEVSEQLNISADTLRYYEKIKLLPSISRTNSGLRNYSKKDLSRIKFIKRAQRMKFSLEEIASLLKFREHPQTAKSEVRKLANQRLIDIEEHLVELQTLRTELTLLVGLCQQTEDGCPILENFNNSMCQD